MKNSPFLSGQERWLDLENTWREWRNCSFQKPEDMINFLCGTECNSAFKSFSEQVRTWALGTFQEVLKCGRIVILPKLQKSMMYKKSEFSLLSNSISSLAK